MTIEKQIEECEQEIKKLEKKLDRVSVSPVSNSVNEEEPSTVSEEELLNHFQEVARSLSEGSLIFFIGSGINSIKDSKDSNLPPSDEQIADALIKKDLILETNSLIGFPCEICPLKTVDTPNEFQQELECHEPIFSEIQAKIKPSFCPFIKNKTPELRKKQRLREAKYELRCRAEYWKDILHAEPGLVDQLSYFFRNYKYEPNSLQEFLAELVRKIKDSNNKNYEAPHQLIVTTTYDFGLERAFDKSGERGESLDVLSCIAQGDKRGQ